MECSKSSSLALMVVLPGALLPPEAYVPLVDVIRKSCQFSLWTAILRFKNNVATEEDIQKQYEALKQELLQKQGFEVKSNDTMVFFAGHRFVFPSDDAIDFPAIFFLCLLASVL